MLVHTIVLPPEHIYPADEWGLVVLEFGQGFAEQAETCFSVSNGYVGVGGSLEEGPVGFPWHVRPRLPRTLAARASRRSRRAPRTGADDRLSAGTVPSSRCSSTTSRCSCRRARSRLWP